MTTSGQEDADTRQQTGRLAEQIRAFAPHDGSFPLKVPGVHAVRRSQLNAELSHGVAESSLCIVAQGAKSITLGAETWVYDESRMIVFSVDVPVSSQLVRASRAVPFLGLKLELDPAKIASHVLKVYPNGLPKVSEDRAVFVGQSDPKILGAAVRLLDVMAEPNEAELLAPLVVDEIVIRLLRGPMGPRVAQIGVTDSGVYGVTRAIAFLRSHFAQPVKVEELASLSNMSPSAFHQHFKSVTSMSPLQFQKVLRLQEARRLMLSSMMDAGVASRQVGYLSASQFSREYGRFFGTAPTKDIARLREEMAGIGEI